MFPNYDIYDYRRNCREVRKSMKQQQQDENAGLLVSIAGIVTAMTFIGIFGWIVYSFRDVLFQ